MADGFERYEDDPENTSLAQAQAWVREHRRVGAYCPCCTQLAKVYRRKLNSSMAYALILIHRRDVICYDEYFHVPSYLAGIGLKGGVAAAVRGDWAKLVHWGLIDPRQCAPDNGARTSGYWRITEKGRMFVEGNLALPSHALFFDSECLGLCEEKLVDIIGALGEKFDYHELMNA